MRNFRLVDCVVEQWSIKRLKPFDDNPRLHPELQLEMLEASILRSHHINPILVAPDGTIIAGHARYIVARRLGLSEVPVIVLAHLTDAEQAALRVADNAISERATWSVELLAKNLELISTLDLTIQPIMLGFETGEYDKLRIERAAVIPAATVPLPDYSKPAISKVGDTIRIGRQTIICGDSRDPGVYEQGLAGHRARAVISDQPWNLKSSFISGKGKTKFANFAMASGEMSPEEFASFTEAVLKLQARWCEPGALVFQFIDWRSVEMMIAAGRKTIGDLINICVWVKQNGRFGSPWRSRHELICVFRREGGKSRDNVKLGKHGRNRTNVWEYEAPSVFGSQRDKLQMHPTCKSEALIADVILDCTDRNDIVLDAFLGSGTTLLAAHQTGRRGVGIEIDPHYVDLAVKRVADLTGETPVLLDGSPFGEGGQCLGEKA